MPVYIANRNMTYNTRRLKAGDELQASRRDGDLLIRLGRVTEVPAALAQTTSAAFKVPPPPPVPPIVHQAAATSYRGDALAAAREEYERVVGKKWFHGWDETELRKRIAEYQGS
jgi:hypothetical protein